MKGIWRVCVLVIVFISCNPGVDIDNTPVDKLLYVDGRISPCDTVLRVYIVRPYGFDKQPSSESREEKDALVTISDGAAEAVLKYNVQTRRYEAPNPFQEAKDETRFTLRITAPGGINIVAYSTLPPKPKLISSKGSIHSNILGYNLIWENPTGHKYFRAWANLAGLRSDYLERVSFVKSIESLAFEPGIYFWDRQPTGLNSITDSTTVRGEFAGPTKLNFILANMEESIWKYEKTFSSYDTWLSNAEESSIVPIFREPAQIHYNINGGFGLFASYNCAESTEVIIVPGE